MSPNQLKEFIFDCSSFSEESSNQISSCLSAREMRPVLVAGMYACQSHPVFCQGTVLQINCLKRLLMSYTVYISEDISRQTTTMSANPGIANYMCNKYVIRG